MISDQDVRNKVLDITKSFLVQAPAGSGKTGILVQRFLKALANAQNGPEEIIAITFTRKAAAEMRERILSALQLAMIDAPESAYELQLWNLGKAVLQRDEREGWQLLNNPARLKIQTIDALCASITRQMPIVARFGAQPHIEQQAAHLYSLAVNQLLQILSSDNSSPGRNGLIKLLQHLDNDRLKVKKLLTNMLQNRDHWLPIIAQHMHAQNLRQYLEQGLLFACEEALEDLNELVPPVLDVAVMSHDEPQTLGEWLTIIDKLLTADGEWRKQVSAAQGFAAPSKATNKEEKQRLKECKDAMHAMLDRLRPHEEFRQQLLVLRELPPMAYTDQQWAVVDALVEVLPVLAAHLTMVFRDQGQVDFMAVALAALGALQDQSAPTDLSLALDCKISHILVDEFQDTSHVQFRLLECLTANWTPDDGRTLFLVGDPMQSIYRFRQADVGLFLRAKEYGIGNVTLEFAQLKVNFRSSAQVMHWINNVFGNAFPKVDNKTLGAITYMPASAANQNIEDQAAVNCVAVRDEFEPAEIIKIIQEHKYNSPAATIAILVRAKNHLLRILPALRAAEIAYQGIDIENLSKRPIIQDLTALTRAILHLDDRIAWLAILRAPWCALSLADLSVIARHDATIFAALQNVEIMQQISPDAMQRIEHLAHIMRDALALLGKQSLTSVVRFAFVMLGGRDCMRHAAEEDEVTAFFSLLSKLQNDPQLHVPDYLEQQLDRLFLEPPRYDPNAVQIMTMHKAKGLEFDVVILPGLTKAIRHQDQQLLLLEQREYEHKYLLIAPIRAADQTEDAIYKYMAWCERQREEYETLRQLYVAATRAKQHIYCLADVASGSAGGMLGQIWPYVRDQFDASVQHEEIVYTRTLDLRRLPDDHFVCRYRSAGYTLQKREVRVWQPNWVNAAGTVLHRVLWHVTNVGVEQLPKDYVKQLPRMCQHHLRSLGVTGADQTVATQTIVRALECMLNDQLGARILSSQHKEAYSEWRLTTVAKHKTGPQCKQIRLDRVFVDHDDTVWLIDYKLVLSNDGIAESIHNNTAQLTEYVAALKALKPANKLVAGLYFPLQAHWQQVF